MVAPCRCGFRGWMECGHGNVRRTGVWTRRAPARPGRLSRKARARLWRADGLSLWPRRFYDGSPPIQRNGLVGTTRCATGVGAEPRPAAEDRADSARYGTTANAKDARLDAAESAAESLRLR